MRDETAQIARDPSSVFANAQSRWLMVNNPKSTDRMIPLKRRQLRGGLEYPVFSTVGTIGFLQDDTVIDPADISAFPTEFRFGDIGSPETVGAVVVAIDAWRWSRPRRHDNRTLA